MISTGTILAQLGPDEFEELVERVFTDYNQSFDIQQIERQKDDIVVTVQLASGASRVVVLANKAGAALKASGKKVRAAAEPSDVVYVANSPERRDGLLAVHDSFVASCLARLKNDAQIVKNVLDAKRIVEKTGTRTGYQTILFHGPTLAPVRRTICRTFDDGSQTVWTERLDSYK